VIFDAIPGASGPDAENEEQIAAAKIQKLTIPRTEGKLMHNKFFVLTRNSKPVAVWTGSTNLTENGIFGHSNCGHVVEDKDVASTYFTYWQKLKSDPDPNDTKDWIGAENVAPPNPWSDDTTVVFSPRRNLDPLNWYGEIAGGAQKGLFMTFAFGMNKIFQQVYEQNDGVLRFALMEKEGNGKGLEQGRKDVRRIRSLPNVVVAVGNNMSLNTFDRWLKEIDRVTKEVNVRWIHTKYMLVDPLGDNPVVVTGSANFSDSSTETNDENMLVIRNDQRIADIYLGEFMRLHAHYAFREAVAIASKSHDFGDWQPKYLVPSADWQKDYFSQESQRFLRRVYFAGP
jgi:phosphatidylserine/phosphatidylglycerophosphate/cardiolipin synthase-like enzyme